MKKITLIKVSSLGLALFFSGAAYAASQPSPTFLTIEQAPNSLALLPPPPSESSIAFLADKDAYIQGLALRDTPRGQQAVTDADLSDANIGKPFSAALGVDISPKNTPITYDLLRKIRGDAGGLATKSAKNHYMRVRPFMYYNVASCTPQDESGLRKNGSYPSGHTAIGWTTALVLVEIRPARQAELLQRGYEFGQSRVICGAHWQSDVDAGRIMGAADFARLNADPAFVAEVKAAKEEIDAKIKSK